MTAPHVFLHAVEHQLARERAELVRLDTAYKDALRRSMSAEEIADISAAFDEADALQHRLLRSLHRARQLERQLAKTRTADRAEELLPAVAQPADAA